MALSKTGRFLNRAEILGAGVFPPLQQKLANVARYGVIHFGQTWWVIWSFSRNDKNPEVEGPGSYQIRELLCAWDVKSIAFWGS